MSELEKLDYEDALVNFNSILEQNGCRQTLLDFRDAFPAMYHELVIQIGRIPPSNQVAALLR